jgi:hypothetical protein
MTPPAPNTAQPVGRRVPSVSSALRVLGQGAFDLAVRAKWPVRVRVERSPRRVLRGQVVRRDHDRCAQPCAEFPDPARGLPPKPGATQENSPLIAVRLTVRPENHIPAAPAPQRRPNTPRFPGPPHALPVSVQTPSPPPITHEPSPDAPRRIPSPPVSGNPPPHAPASPKTPFPSHDLTEALPPPNAADVGAADNTPRHASDHAAENRESAEPAKSNMASSRRARAPQLTASA